MNDAKLEKFEKIFLEECTIGLAMSKKNEFGLELAILKQTQKISNFVITKRAKRTNVFTYDMCVEFHCELIGK